MKWKDNVHIEREESPDGAGMFALLSTRTSIFLIEKLKRGFQYISPFTVFLCDIMSACTNYWTI